MHRRLLESQIETVRLGFPNDGSLLIPPASATLVAAHRSPFRMRTCSVVLASCRDAAALDPAWPRQVLVKASVPTAMIPLALGCRQLIVCEIDEWDGGVSEHLRWQGVEVC